MSVKITGTFFLIENENFKEEFKILVIDDKKNVISLKNKPKREIEFSFEKIDVFENTIDRLEETILHVNLDEEKNGVISVEKGSTNCEIEELVKILDEVLFRFKKNKKKRKLEMIENEQKVEISSDDFYGEITPQWKLKLLSITKEEDKISSFRIFNRQELAFNYVDSNSNNKLRVFVQEFQTNPTRRFIVATISDIYKLISQTEEEKRCFYEMIREDAHCNCYFDLEFPKQYNKDLDGHKLIDIFLEEAIFFFFKIFPKINLKKNQK